jgi:hypothetical protein
MKCPDALSITKKLMIGAALCALASQGYRPAEAVEDTAGGAKPPTTLLKGGLQQSEQLDWLAKVGITAAPKPAQPQALMVSAVQSGSPAYYGGVAANDRIAAIDAKDGFLKVTIDRGGHFYQASIKADFLQGQTARNGQTALKGVVGQTSLGGGARYNQAPVSLKQEMPTTGVTRPFSAGIIARDGADGIEQSAYPDCWFLGTLAALAHSSRGPQLICEMIAEREPGYYYVKFPGADEAVTESEADRVQYSLANRANWANLLEATCLQKYNAMAVAFGPRAGESAIKTAMEFLTGVPAVNLRPDSMDTAALEDLLDRLCRSGTPAAVATKGAPEHRSVPILTENHCYSVMSFDRSTDMVTLRNCYGMEPPGRGGASAMQLGVRNLGGGLVEVPLVHFQHYIRFLCYPSR